MSCPQPEVVLRFAEGHEVPPATVVHLAACRACQAQLGALGRFETHLATESTMDADERRQLRDVTARALASHRGHVRRRRGIAGALLAVAAVAVTALTCWPQPRLGLTDLAVHRYVPDAIVRAERLERFSLQLRLDAPRWLAAWQLGRQVTRLLPHADPLLQHLGAEMPLRAGTHRLPAVEVLDFEFAAAQPPQALVVVPSARELTAAELATIEALLATTPRAELAAALAARWPEARVSAFPAN
jgi:hypothetical protein